MNCPVCNGEMYDQSKSKFPRKPGSPDWKCMDKECKFKLDQKTGAYVAGEYTTGVWDNAGDKVFEGTKPKKILIATGHPNPAQNNNALKEKILNNASALTIKFADQMAAQQMWLNESEIDAYLERRIKAIAGMMMGLQI
jgi:hypothetical protein